MSDTPNGFDEYLSVEQVAQILNVSVNTVARQFENLPGTFDAVGSKEKMNKRRRRCLRIPRATLRQFIEARQTKRK